MGIGGVAAFFLLRWTNQLFAVVPSLIEPRSEPLTLSSQKVDFVSARLSAFQRANPSRSTPTIALMLAQAAYESGWGKGFASRTALNDWNLTDGSIRDGVVHRVGRWKGAVVQGADTEYTAGNAKPVKITQLFCKYEDLEQAGADYFAFLSNPRYADAMAKLGAADPEFIVDLGVNRLVNGQLVRAWPAGVVKGGFYTLPIDEYRANFMACLADVTQILGSLLQQ